MATVRLLLQLLQIQVHQLALLLDREQSVLHPVQLAQHLDADYLVPGLFLLLLDEPLVLRESMLPAKSAMGVLVAAHERKRAA